MPKHETRRSRKDPTAKLCPIDHQPLWRHLTPHAPGKTPSRYYDENDMLQSHPKKGGTTDAPKAA